MVRAIALPREEAIAAWSKIRTEFDSHCNNHEFYRLVPQLYRSLVDKDIDDELLPLIRGAYKKNWYKNVLLFQRAAAILADLNAAKIDTIVLNEIPLELSYYKHVGTLYISHVDILVPNADHNKALAILDSLGFVVQTKSNDPHLFCGVRLVDTSGHRIDLHWFLMVEDPVESADQKVWCRAIPMAVQGSETKALDHSSTLFQICVQGFRSCGTSSHWVLDALQVIKTAPEIDWNYILDTAKQRKVSYQLRTTLTYLAGSFNAEIPEQVLHELQSSSLTLIEWCDLLWSENSAIGGSSGRLLTYCRGVRNKSRRPSISRFLTDLTRQISAKLKFTFLA